VHSIKLGELGKLGHFKPKVGLKTQALELSQKIK